MIFQDIRTAILTRLGSILPTYHVLANQINYQDNTDRQLEKGLSVTWGRSSPTTGPLNKHSFVSDVIITLTKSLETRLNDDVAPSIDVFYGDVETILRSTHDRTFLGIPDKIRGLRQPVISSPVLFNDNRFVAVQVTIPVDFTFTINF